FTRPVAAPPPVKPSGRRAFTPKLATTFIAPSGTVTVPPPVTTATVSGLIAATAVWLDMGSMRPCAMPADSATPVATTATAASPHGDRARASRPSVFRIGSDLPPCGCSSATTPNAATLGRRARGGERRGPDLHRILECDDPRTVKTAGIGQRMRVVTQYFLKRAAGCGSCKPGLPRYGSAQAAPWSSARRRRRSRHLRSARDGTRRARLLDETSVRCARSALPHPARDARCRPARRAPTGHLGLCALPAAARRLRRHRRDHPHLRATEGVDGPGRRDAPRS